MRCKKANKGEIDAKFAKFGFWKPKDQRLEIDQSDLTREAIACCNVQSQVSKSE
jgi:hypothetical protein